MRHVDNPDDNGRVLTVLYYCNPGWRSEHGGAIRLFPPERGAARSRAGGGGGAGAREEPVDVEPHGDRLLVFWSDARTPHAVLPAEVDRYAVTFWMMDTSKYD